MVKLSGDLWRLELLSDRQCELCSVMGRVCDMARCNKRDSGLYLPQGRFDVEVTERESPSKFPHFHVFADKEGVEDRFNVRFRMDGVFVDVESEGSGLKLGKMKRDVPLWLLEPTRDRALLRRGCRLNVQVLVFFWLEFNFDNRFTPALVYESFLMDTVGVDLARLGHNVYVVGESITVDEAREWVDMTEGMNDAEVFDYTGSMFPNLVS